MEDNKTTMETGEVAEIVQQMLADDREKMNGYAKIDEAVNCIFNPDAAVAQLPFVQGRQFALPDISDARNAGTRVFTSLLPNINIAPVVDNEGEYDRVDKMEQAWKWEMEKMNRPVNGKKGIHDLIVESAVTYHAVAMQTEYLPYKFKNQKSDPRIQAILRRKNFQWSIFHPGTVHAKYSEFGLESVAKISDYTALELIQNFGEEGKAKIIDDAKTDKKSELMRMKYTLVDFTNWKHRVQMAFPSIGGGMTNPQKGRIVFMNEEHKLPFIPWVIVDYGDPLWQAIIKSGHWNNIQHMKLIKFSKSIAQAGKPDFLIKTSDGTLKGVWLDWKNPNNPLVMPLGNEYQDIAPNKLDPQFEAEYQEDRADVARSTVARILQDPTPFLNSPFSTFNAASNTALAQLSPAKRTAETAEAEAIQQGFQWIKHSDIPFNAYRAKNTDSKMQEGEANRQGGQITIMPGDPPDEKELEEMNEKEQAMLASSVYFSLDQLYISVELKSANITDEQSRMNTYLLAVEKAGMSQKELWERMGWDGFDISRLQKAGEAMFEAEVQGMLTKKNQEVIEQMRNEIMQQMQAEQEEAAKQQQAAAQQPQQPQNAVNDMNAQNQFASMQGADLRSGGMAAAQVAPNETREAVTGQTRGGGEMV